MGFMKHLYSLAAFDHLHIIFEFDLTLRPSQTYFGFQTILIPNHMLIDFAIHESSYNICLHAQSVIFPLQFKYLTIMSSVLQAYLST